MATGGGATALIAIGGSWGGVAAMRVLLPALAPARSAAVALVLHRAQRSSGLAQTLGRLTPWDVREVHDKDPLRPATVHLAPADYHLLVERDGLALSVDPPVNFSRPSVDLLFWSAAVHHRGILTAVVLTGANSDGARGALHVRERGGRVIVQDPETAVQSAMPRAAIAAGAATDVLPLEEIGPRVVALVGAGGRTP